MKHFFGEDAFPPCPGDHQTDYEPARRMWALARADQLLEDAGRHLLYVDRIKLTMGLAEWILKKTPSSTSSGG